jgi:hypothetical protein
LRGGGRSCGNTILFPLGVPVAQSIYKTMIIEPILLYCNNLFLGDTVRSIEKFQKVQELEPSNLLMATTSKIIGQTWKISEIELVLNV